MDFKAKYKIRSVIMIIIWMVFIFGMSHFDGDRSWFITGEVLTVTQLNALEEDASLDERMVKYDDDDQWLPMVFIRKSAHFLEFFVLAVLFMNLFGDAKNIRRRMVLSFGLTVLYAISDEFHQLFIPGRSGNIKDILIDAIGACVGVWFYRLMMMGVKMEFFRNILKGMIVGIGAVAPGVSGGTFAVILGLYDKLTDAIGNFHVNFQKKLLFMMPIGLGVGMGILLFSHLMNALFENYNIEMKFLFIGLMLGTMPTVFKDANKKGMKKIYLVPFILTLIASVIFFKIDQGMLLIKPNTTPDILLKLLFGAIIGVGTIVPGVSSSFMLMAVGGYELLLDAIVNVDFVFLLPVTLGFGVSIILFSKLINLLFKNFYGYTYYGILGFVIASISFVFPSQFSLEEVFVGLLLFASGLWLSLNLSRKMG